MGPTAIIIIVLFILLISIRQVNQYERGVMFTFGKYTGTKQPGWRLVIPIFQRMHKVDMRVKAVDVPDQETITQDNIPIKINAVIYYKVKDASMAYIEVQNFYYAVSQLAQTTIRSAAGEVTLDDLLSKRTEISEKIKISIDEATDKWGIDVSSVDLKDITLPENLKRTIAKAAEAEREKRAVIIKAEGDKMAAQNIADAAKILKEVPGALHLRTLQAVNDLSSDQSNTTVWMIPIDVLQAVEGFAHSMTNKK